MPAFHRSIAIAIGIDEYAQGIPRLQTAVADAGELARILEQDHGYAARLLTQDVTLARLRELLCQILPNEVGPDDRVLCYFAGHGIALDGDDGPAGFLIPQDARRDDRATFLPMTELHDALIALPCRHLLLVLDCCFAGSFRWSATRDFSSLPARVHKERYDRYIRDRAWYVLTSAAHDQTALDVLGGAAIGARKEEQAHSPFAAALFRGLAGEADLIPRATDGQPGGDGVITATELYVYLRELVETQSAGQGSRQTPSLWPLKKHDKGEYIVLVPGHELALPPAPELNAKNNPYRGLQSYDEEHGSVFFGRTRVVGELHKKVAGQALTVVLGASGTGKSSVVKAGLLPELRRAAAEGWQIVSPIRPGKSPLRTLAELCLPGEEATGVKERLVDARLEPQALANRVDAWAKANPNERLLLVVDQFEELITLCWDSGERDQFLTQFALALESHPERLHVILTLRSDFEPQFATCALKDRWVAARDVVPPMSQDELREAIEGPASARVLYFKPTELVDRLINDVVQTPGALPLLSFTLRELYVKYCDRGGDDRCLTLEDYEQLGGVAGSLRNRATEEYDGQRDDAHRATMRRVMLRMVSLEGGELARRRVPQSELVYADPAENLRVTIVLERLTTVRLVVSGIEIDGRAYVEPAHDEFVRGWDKLMKWTKEEQEQFPLRRLLSPAAADWKSGKGGLWWANPRLSLLNQIRRSPENWLNGLEAAFISESAGKRWLILWTTAVTVLLAFLALLGLTKFAFSERNRAEEQRSEVEGRLAQALVDQGSKLLADGHARQSLVPFSEALAIASGERSQPAQGFLDTLSHVFGSPRSRPNQTLIHRRRVASVMSRSIPLIAFPERAWPGTSASLSPPDGKLLFVGAWVCNTLTGERLAGGWRAKNHLLDHGVFCSGGTLLAVYSTSARVVQIREPHSGALLGQCDLRAKVEQVMFSRDGKRLLVAGGKRARVFDAMNANPLTPTYEHPSNLTCSALSPDGSMLALGGSGNILWVWHLNKKPDSTLPAAGAAAVGSSLTIAQALGSIPLLYTYLAKRSHLTAVQLPGPSDPRWTGTHLKQLEFSNDGGRLATATAGTGQGEAMIWDPKTGKPKYGFSPLKFKSGVSSVHFSSRGNALVIATEQGLVYLLEDKFGAKLRRYGIGGFTGRDAFLTPDGRYVVGVRTSETLVWDAMTAETVAQVKCMVQDLHVNGTSLIMVGFVWEQRSFPREGGVPVGTTHVLGQSSLLPSVTYSWRLRLSAEGDRILYHGDNETPTCASFSPDGLCVVTGDRAGRLRLWDVESGQMLLASPEKGPEIRSLGFASNGGSVLVERADTSVQVWNLSAQPSLTAPVRTGVNGTKVKLAPDGRRALFLTPSVSDILGRQQKKATAQLWDVLERRILEGPVEYDGKGLDAHIGTSRCLVAMEVWPTAAEQRDLGLSRRRYAGLLDVRSGRLTRFPLNGDGALRPLLNSDGTTMATIQQRFPSASSPKHSFTVQIWDIETGRETGPALELDGETSFPVLDASGKYLSLGVSVYREVPWDKLGGLVDRPATRSVITLSVAGNKQLTAPVPQQGLVSACAFSPDGEQLVTASSGGAIRIWETATGVSVVQGLPLGDGEARHVVFSPDASRLLTVPWRGPVVGLWDVRPTRRSVRDLGAVATLVAQNQLNNRGALEPLSPDVAGQFSLTVLDRCTGEDFCLFPPDLFRWHRDRITAAETEGDWPTAIKHLNYLLAVSPEDRLLRFHRGYAYAALASWESASLDLTKCMDGTVRDVRCWYLCALVQLARNDLEGYRRVCQDAVARFGDDWDHHREAVLWMIALADQGEFDASTLPRPIIGLKDWPSERRFAIQGAAEYRAGLLKEARKHLEKDGLERSGIVTINGTDMAWRGQRLLLLAMCHYRLGEFGEARQRYLQALKHFRDFPRMGRRNSPDLSWEGWDGQLTLRLLKQEADRLFRPRLSAVPEPRPSNDSGWTWVLALAAYWLLVLGRAHLMRTRRALNRAN
jgi:WD40 repeat protein